MTYEFIVYEKRDRVAHIRINRPDRLNALDAQANIELRHAFEDFRDDPDVWVAIITGTGERAFCAGGDLKAHNTVDPSRFLSANAGESRIVFGGITSDFECSKPIIAAVNGLALGGGTEIVLACDIAVAAEHAQFALPEPLVGRVAGAGGTARLPRQVPLKHAMGMILTGRRVTAAEAVELGLVNEVVPADELADAAQRWADLILRCSPTSVQISKEMVLKGLEQSSPDAAIGGDDERLKRLFASEDFNEGPRAFAEKREPRWTGR